MNERLGMNERLHLTRWVILVVACGVSCLLVGCLRQPNQELTELIYTAPVEIGLDPGDFIPGTEIRFEGLDDTSAVIFIGNQRAVKQKGDSLDWSGQPVVGTDVKLTLRIAWFTEVKLFLVGTARIQVEGPVPTVVNVPDDIPMTYHAPVAYGVAREALIPGTTVSYVGDAEEGAQLGGMEGYPFRKSGDSIVWEGKLRERVYLQMNARVVHFGADAMRVAGLATISILP